MTIKNSGMMFAVAATLFLGAAKLPAQSQFTCSSDDGRRHYCNADTRGGVQMVNQRSGSPCEQGRTWGYDRRGVWVDRGCRADFVAGGGRPGFGDGGRPGFDGGRPGRTQIITCSSDDGKRHWCSADTERYRARLVRQISGSSCRQGRSWGMQPGSVWVDRGCRAEFEVMLPR